MKVKANRDLYSSFKVLIISLVLVTSLLSVISYKSMSEFPSQGLSLNIGFGGEARYYNRTEFVHLVYLYPEDRVTLNFRVSAVTYNLTVVIQGLLRNHTYRWSTGISSYGSHAPVFIPEYPDWYLITSIFTVHNSDGEWMIDLSISSFEVPRDGVYHYINMIAPIIIVATIFSLLGLYILSRKLRLVGILTWEILSIYKWIIPIIAFLSFLDIFSAFKDIILFEYLPPPGTYFDLNRMNISSYQLLEGVYAGFGVGRAVNLLIIYSIIVNLINISYYNDRRFHRVYTSMGLSKLNIYMLKFLSGLILIFTPYLMSKILLDIVIFQEPNILAGLYGEGFLYRFLIDLYIVLYYYSMIFFATIIIKNSAVALPIAISPLLVKSWLSNNQLVNRFMGFPFRLRRILLSDIPQPILTLENLPYLTLPFILLLISLIIYLLRDLD